MIYKQLLMANHKGDLGLVWMAAHFPKRLRKDLVQQTNITSSVEKILVDQLPVVTYRILGFLLLGVARIYSKKVEYLLHDCNISLNEMKIHLQEKRKVNIDVSGMCTPESSNRRSKLSIVEVSVPESSRRNVSDAFLEAMHSQLSSISLPKSFELDAFDLEIVEDESGEEHVKSHSELVLQDDAWENDRNGSHTFGKDWWGASSSFTDHASPYATVTNTNPSEAGPSYEKLRDRFSLEECLNPMILDETDELEITEIPSIEKDPGSKNNTNLSDDYMISENLQLPDKEDYKSPDEQCTTGETTLSKMSIVGSNLTVKPSPQKHQLSVSIDVTPQSKLPVVSGEEHKPDFVAVHTPASKEHALTRRKRRFVYDDTIVIPNKVYKIWLADASDIVGTRKKAPDLFLARKHNRSFDFVLKPIIPINADFPSDLKNHEISTTSKPLQKDEDMIEADVPKSDETDVPKSDEFGSVSTPPRISEQNEAEVLAPSTPVTRSSSSRFNDFLETPKGKQVGPTDSYDCGEKEGFLIKDVESDEDQTKEGPSPLGEDIQKNEKLSAMTKSVGSYLHGNFMQRKKRGEDEVVNLYSILKHKNKNESARFFYEILILKMGGYIDVKQEKAYDDIHVMQTLKLKKVFG